MQHFFDMRVQPVLAQDFWRHILRTRDSSSALLYLAATVKRLRHVKLCTRIEKCELFSRLQALLSIRVNANLPSLHIEHKRRSARMVYVYQVAIQLDVEIP